MTTNSDPATQVEIFLERSFHISHVCSISNFDSFLFTRRSASTGAREGRGLSSDVRSRAGYALDPA